MPRKRKETPGGPVRHAIPYWLRTGRIHSTIVGAEKIQKYLMDLERQLIADQGGPESLTAAQEILTRATIKAYGVVLLSELFISKYSPLRPDQLEKGILQYQPILETSYFSQLAQIRHNLLALGLNKRVKSAKKIVDINAYLEARRKEKASESRQAEAQAVSSGEAEIAPPESTSCEVSTQEKEAEEVFPGEGDRDD